jgi:RNA polymerase sigma factor (sigma-70 family)
MREQDFERLYAENARPLLAFLVYRTGDRPLAEDLLADTFERVLTARRPFDPRRASERTWLYSIALNLVRDHARRSARGSRVHQQVIAGAPEGILDPGYEQIEHRDSLQHALTTLSPEEREAIALRFGAELTVPEVARLIGQPLSTAEGRVSRALRKLKQALE